MASLGKHILVELYDCTPALLDDTAYVERSMLGAAKAVGATVISATFHQFAPYGSSGVVVIQESHLAIHTWPEFGYAAVDFFTCGDEIDPWECYDFLKKKLEAKNGSALEMRRGERSLLVAKGYQPKLSQSAPGEYTRELWFTERAHDLAFSLRQKAEPLFSRQSAYQKVEVFESFSFGKVLLLDGHLVMSEKDEAAFHEMLAHIPLFAHPKPQNVLVLGGGDGGTAREALRHPEVQKVHMVEQDPVVPEAAKLFPRFREVFESERLTLEIGDALGTLRGIENATVDVLLLDAQDAIQPDPGLFSAGFFAEVARVLKPDGIFATHAGAPALEPEILQHTQAQLKPHFQHREAYLTTLSTLPTGLCVFLIAEKEGEVNFITPPHKERFENLSGKENLQYYTPKIHAASFALPRFVDVLV